MSIPTLRLIGAAAAFGVKATLAYDGVVVANNTPQSHDLTDDFIKQDFMDGRGNTIGRAGHNRARTGFQRTYLIVLYSCSSLLITTERKRRSRTWPSRP